MIERDQAVEIARKRAIAKEWAFVEPLNVIIRRSWLGAVSRFEIETNSGNRGTKAHSTLRGQFSRCGIGVVAVG